MHAMTSSVQIRAKKTQRAVQDIKTQHRKTGKRQKG